MSDFLCRRRKTNKKKARRAPGVTSSALQEAHEIFGDVDELLEIRKQGLDSSEWRERRLEDEFEPIILSEKYMTEKDDQIRMTDIPERMQVSTHIHTCTYYSIHRHTGSNILDHFYSEILVEECFLLVSCCKAGFLFSYLSFFFHS